MAEYHLFGKTKEVMGSPGRMYSKEFLYNNLSKLLFKKEIKMLDIGCGQGSVRKIFYDLGYKLFYTGIDIEKYKNFGQFNQYTVKSELVSKKIEDLHTDNKYDLIFSSSTLEHIENDVLAIAKAQEFLDQGGIQIHIVPTFWSLFLYPFHGHRGYTKIRLKKIFGKNCQICNIGGFFSFLLHLFSITILERIFKNNKLRDFNIYPRILNVANNLDRFLPILPSIYIAVAKNENKIL